MSFEDGMDELHGVDDDQEDLEEELEENEEENEEE